jgi:hypothetical protein
MGALPPFVSTVVVKVNKIQTKVSPVLVERAPHAATGHRFEDVALACCPVLFINMPAEASKELGSLLWLKFILRAVEGIFYLEQ